jgi:hypothetical protein
LHLRQVRCSLRCRIRGLGAGPKRRVWIRTGSPRPEILLSK